MPLACLATFLAFIPILHLGLIKTRFSKSKFFMALATAPRFSCFLGSIKIISIILKHQMAFYYDLPKAFLYFHLIKAKTMLTITKSKKAILTLYQILLPFFTSKNRWHITCSILPPSSGPIGTKLKRPMPKFNIISQ